MQYKGIWLEKKKKKTRRAGSWQSYGYIDRRSVHVKEGLNKLEKLGAGEQILNDKDREKRGRPHLERDQCAHCKPKGTGPMNAPRRTRDIIIRP